MKETLLWKPDNHFIDSSNLKRYQNWLRDKYGLEFANYREIWEWSVDNLEDFWESLWHFFEIKFHSPYQTILSGSEMPYYSWFEGATLNYTEHIFRNSHPDRDALVCCDESGGRETVSWKELEAKVVALRTFMIAKGIGKGDRVVAYLPNRLEAVVAFYATNSLGAIWSCCSPDFGYSTVIDRFAQIEPKLFITTDGYLYGGKSFDRSKEAEKIIDSLPTLETVILVSSGHGSGLQTVDVSSWEEIQNNYANDGELEFQPVPFEHPIWILYSSGTTGKPKAITHSHGGVLLEHLKYLYFHNDVKPGENFFWFTTTGWMMWNFLQASLLTGATAVLFDGSPAQPNLNALWKLSEALPIHHFGTSAPFLTACMKGEMNPGKDFNLSQLRSIGSTGAPLPPEAFDWVYQSISSSVWLCSMSGGTDVCTAFVGGCPYEPVYGGLIQCRALGCKMESYNEDGSPQIDSLGEMVVESPMPSMPIFFWNDLNHQRYTDSYFDKYAGKWCHGDWINIRKNGQLTIHGRSDATLNRKGIRIGTAEIYAALTDVVGISDSLILNLEKEDGSDFMPLFVVLTEGQEIDDSLIGVIKQTLKIKCSPRHVPDLIMSVKGIPYTLSGKKMEVPIKKLLLGMEANEMMNKDSVRNPETVEEFAAIAPSIRAQYLT